MAEKIIIASGKGGSGKTSLCTGLAMSLRKNGNFVLIVDCDIAQGCIDFMLSTDSNALYSWGDIISSGCEYGDAICSGGGVDYLTAPKKFKEEYTCEEFKKLIDHLDNKYSYIIFDSPAGITGGFSLAAGCADKGIVVSTPDEVCVRAAARAVDELYDAGVEDVRLVINRFDKESTQNGKYLNIDETIDAVKAQLIGVVPEDKTIAFASSTGFANLEDCPAKAAYERIAIRLSGGQIKLNLKNKKKNFSKKKEKKERKKSVIGFAFKTLLITFAVAFTLVAGTTVLEIYNANRRFEPKFVFPMLTVETENGKLYRGTIYTFEVSYDEEGKIVFSEMKIGGRVIASAMNGDARGLNND